MRTIIYDVVCPKCKHKFDADTGWNELEPFQYKQDAIDEMERLSKTQLDMIYSLKPCNDGWMIHGESK